MAKQNTSATPKTIKAKFQVTSVGNDRERVYMQTVDTPDASGKNENTVLGGAQLTIQADDEKDFFLSGGEYYVEFTPVAAKV
ncbi:hypothetical protein [Spirosoma areae]